MTFFDILRKKKTVTASLTAIALTFATTAGADTVILNNGIKHEGTLISETPDMIQFEVGKSVKQIRRIKRSDIKSLVIVPNDELALPTIRAMIPSADLLSVSDYTRLIEGAPKNFLRVFPDSKHRAEVERVIATLEADAQKVRDGGAKIDGKWITKEQIEAAPVNHEGRVALAGLKKTIATGKLLESLRAFDALEKNYAGTSSFPEAIATVEPVLAKQSAALAAQFAKSERNNKRRNAGFARMGEAERKASEAALARELAPFLEAHAAAKKAKNKWLDFHAFDLASIADAQKEVTDEQARLEKIDTAKLTADAEAIDEAADLLAEGKFKEASASLKTLGKIQSGSRAAELKTKIDTGMKEAVAEAKKIAARMKEQKAAEAKAIAQAKKKNITTPISTPKEKANPKPEAKVASATNDIAPNTSNDLTEEDGIEFDRTAGEASESSGGGLSFVTVALVLIPIMGAVTFYSLKAAKNNQVEDFVPDEPEEAEPAVAEEKGALDDYDNTPLI